MTPQEIEQSKALVESAKSSGLITGNTCTDVATTQASVVPVEGGNLELSASTPREMVESHQAMIGWCERKIIVMQSEANELRDAYEHAKEKKWKSDTLKRHAELADKRVVFYLGRELGDISSAGMGRIFHKDHGTVLHGCQKIRNRIETDHKFKELVGQVMSACQTRLNAEL